MFLHIGNSRVVSLQDLVGIFNMDLKDNKTNQQFLESFPSDQSNKNTREANNAFIITKEKAYYSPISPLTLQRRVEKKQI